MFESLLSIITETLQAAGGEMEYPALHEATDGALRQHLPRAKRHLKATGQLEESMTWDKEQNRNVHVWRLIGGS